jgi:tRNA A37 methylthiotransferase MiaB
VKYSIVTFGCRVNQADSLGFEEELLLRGGTAVAPEDAELVLVNTCSVTATADQGARQTIRRIARNNPAARIVATGCYATRRPDEVLALPNVVRVVANDDKPKAISLLSTDFGLTTAVRFGEGDGSCGSAIEPGMAGRTAFTLRVQTGCAQRCSYCIIPATRGRPRSVPIDDVLAQVKRVVAAGFKEIALTGVHLGSYGRDLSPLMVRCSGSVRSSQWTVHARSSISSPAAAASRRTSISRCSTRAIGCSAPCDGRTRSSTTHRSSTTSAGVCRTRRSARTSSSDFPERLTMTSHSSRVICRALR